MSLTDKFIISKSLLRSRIGNPSDDPREIGHVTDQELEDIINHHKNIYDIDKIAYESIKLMIDSGTINIGDYDIGAVTISPTSEDGNDLVSKYEISEVYYPLPFKVMDYLRDYEYSLTPSIEKTNNFKIERYNRYRYTVRGRYIYTIPKQDSDILVWLPKLEDLAESSIAVDPKMRLLIDNINENIVNNSLAMLQAKIIEGKRLKESEMI